MDKKDLFKAKKIGSEEWVVGNRIDNVNTGQVFIHPVEELLIRRHNDNNIANTSLVADEVNPETICRCTGRCNKKGKLIWENDIAFVKDEDGCSGQMDTGIGEISFLEGLWYIEGGVQNGLFSLIDRSFQIEIIGNLFDNPELLESSNELEEHEL